MDFGLLRVQKLKRTLEIWDGIGAHRTGSDSRSLNGVGGFWTVKNFGVLKDVREYVWEYVREYV